MSKAYYFENDKFVIKNFDRQRSFFSFLPGVAGKNGIPIWAYYTNRGQGVAGFGICDKSTPITPFNSACIAEADVVLNGFRTYVKINGKTVPCFEPSNVCDRTMEIRMHDFSVIERNEELGYELKVNYFGLPNESFPALMRKVTFTNLSGKDIELEIIDGLPYVFPYGLTTAEFKETVNLRRSWSEVINLNKKVPYFKLRCTTNDTSETQDIYEGNFYLSFIEDKKPLDIVVDTGVIFDYDSSLQVPFGFIKKSVSELAAAEQTIENRILAAFALAGRKVVAGKSVTIYSIIGQMTHVDKLNGLINTIATKKYFEAKSEEAKRIIDDLTNAIELHTANPLFDNYAKQCFLDNGLRGGFPVLLDNGKDGEAFYLFSRKHGDLERDYNWFMIPATNYSSGNGNYRDVNQNRRNDVYFYPFVKDYNINIFFNLSQIDGYNPLDVCVPNFKLKDGVKAANLTDDAEIEEIIAKEYKLADLATKLNSKGKIDDMAKIIGESVQVQNANFGEGYWSDHWTYNLDLIENFLAVYPDKLDELFYTPKYKYFKSNVFVVPRNEKYVMTKSGKVRQFDSADIKSTKGTDWLKDAKGNVVTTTLLAKLIHLALIKFATLDSEGMGVEMEGDKPGWNDAMNGVPGVMGSGLAESVELLRVLAFLKDNLKKFSDKKVTLLSEQAELLKDVVAEVDKFNKGGEKRFNYWDKVATLRERFRASVKDCVKGETTDVSLDEVYSDVVKFYDYLEDGLNRAREIYNGLLPSYLLFEPKTFELTGKKNRLGRETVKVSEFKMRAVPMFLEAIARSFKLKENGVDLKAVHNKVLATELFDKKCKIFKTCVNIENESQTEIGRVRAFTSGWLERESCFLHMTYKYLLGLLKAGLYDEFYKMCETNMVCNMDPEIYGRSTLENSSFIIPSNYPDEKLHGQGFFARLTGANCEYLNMFAIMLFGEKPFTFDGELKCTFNPVLKSDLFDANNDVSFLFLGKTQVTYHNPLRLDTYKASIKSIKIDGKKTIEGNSLVGELAEDLRAGKFKKLEITIG